MLPGMKHLIPDGITFSPKHRPDHRPPRPVRFCDHGIVGNINSIILKADSIVAAPRFPINIADSKAVRDRTT